MTARMLALPAALALGLALLGGTGCSERVVERQRRVTVHQLPACPLPSPEPRIDLEALGDFPASPLSAEAPRGTGQRLLFPAATRSIAGRSQGRGFFGYSFARVAGDVDILLWPVASPCTLAGDAEYPAPGAGRALAFHPGRGVVLVAGGDAGQSSAVVGALTFRTETGVALRVDAAERHVLLEPRAHAAAAAFGDDLIVTGGEDPLVAGPARPPLRTAEVFSVEEGRFLPDFVDLRIARTRHTTALLPSGEVLLVGGRREDDSLVTALEAIDPATRLASLGGLAHLELGRLDPEVIQLDGGGLLVAGGVTNTGEPVAALEWLAPDASEHLGLTEGLPAAFHVTAAPLPGGGALVVLGCGPTGDSAPQDPTAGACAPCDAGCLPPVRAFWLGADRTFEPVELDVDAPRPFLVAGAGGSPWLFTGDPNAPWLRFNPWRARFESAGIRPEVPPTVAQRPLSLDPGAFVWLDEEPTPRLRGLRTTLRHRYSRDLALLQATDLLDASWPLSLCPSRKDAARYVDRALHLTEAAVWLTDVDFADLEIRLSFSGSSPLLLLGAEIFGDEVRPWPPAAEGSDAEAPLRLERAAERVTLRRAESQLAYAGAASGRVAVGFAARPAEASVITALEVSRVRAPDPR